MRERWAWVLLAAGLVLAGLSGLVIYTAARPSAQPVAVTDDRVPVVVALSDIRPLTIVRAELIATRSFPRDIVPADAIRDPAEAIGRTTIDGIPAGVALTEKDFAKSKGEVGSPLTLEAGKVLIVFPTTDPLTAAKLVQPGDRVDIQATLPAGANNTPLTQTIVQNLEVLAVTGERPTLLTFVVDHQTSLVLKHLRDVQAQIDLVVRSRADTQRIRTSAVDLTYLVETYGIRR